MGETDSRVDRQRLIVKNMAMEMVQNLVNEVFQICMTTAWAIHALFHVWTIDVSDYTGRNTGGPLACHNTGKLPS